MISVVVCTCNRPEELRRGLDSLRRQTRRADEIVVVCSGSDRTGASVCADYPEAVVVRIGEDNVSLARDAGIEASRGEQLFFFDDDAEPEPCFLEAMSPLLALPGTGGVGGMVLTPSGACEFRNGVIDRLGRQIPVRRSDEPLPAGFLPTVKGCGCGFRREALAAVGNFDPNFVFSFDEADVALNSLLRRRRLPKPGNRGKELAGGAVQPHLLRAQARCRTRWPPEGACAGPPPDLQDRVAPGGRVSPGRVYLPAVVASPFRTSGRSPRRSPAFCSGRRDGADEKLIFSVLRNGNRYFPVVYYKVTVFFCS